MQLEDYFEFPDPDEIRLKGHRLYVDDIIDLYNEGRSPEYIAQYYPGLSLEKIYATITYYLHNQREVDAAIERLKAYREERARLAEENPSPAMLRLRALQREMDEQGLKGEARSRFLEEYRRKREIEQQQENQ